MQPVLNMNSSDTAIKLNLLCAYPYLKDEVVQLLKREESEIRFVLDSGAFTAWKAGKAISLDSYCSFIEKLPIKPWRYFTLDVIGDPEGSLKNYETMLSRGFNPVPIFTRGEDPKILEHYYSTSDLVGIGGLVGTPKNKGFINGMMDIVGKRKVHWLGFTAMDYIKFYRPYMCDSSSWEGVARFGTMSLYMGNGQFTFIRKDDFNKQTSEPIRNRMKQLGCDSNVLGTKHSWAGGRSISRTLAASNGVALSKDIQANTSTKCFLAFTTKMAGELLIEGWHRQKANRV